MTKPRFHSLIAPKTAEQREKDVREMQRVLRWLDPSTHRGVDYAVSRLYAAERQDRSVLTVSREGTHYRGEWNTFSPRPVKLASCLKR